MYKGDKPFGGLIGLSGIQCLDLKPEILTAEKVAIQKKIPVFLYHGLSDDLLPINNVLLSYQYLNETFESNLTFNTEKGLGHSISPKELRSL